MHADLAPTSKPFRGIGSNADEIRQVCDATHIESQRTRYSQAYKRSSKGGVNLDMDDMYPKKPVDRADNAVRRSDWTETPAQAAPAFPVELIFMSVYVCQMSESLTNPDHSPDNSNVSFLGHALSAVTSWQGSDETNISCLVDLFPTPLADNTVQNWLEQEQNVYQDMLWEPMGIPYNFRLTSFITVVSRADTACNVVLRRRLSQSDSSIIGVQPPTTFRESDPTPTLLISASL
ncbi:MAG: hypothetical protein Q9227_002645 [Pyrenula ochraceoflavens]